MSGLIPARAGNTHRQPVGDLRLNGSSPLARGTRAGERHNVAVEGLIPARAGNTSLAHQKRA